MGNQQPSKHLPVAEDIQDVEEVTMTEIKPVTPGNNYNVTGTLDKLNENPKTLEEHLTNDDNNKNLVSIQSKLNSYKHTNFPPKSNIVHTTPEEQQAVASSWDVGSALAKSYKLVNSSHQALRKAEYARQEKQALENAISNNVTLANELAQRRSMPSVHTKERVSEINNDEFRQKQLMVNRLMYIIYFILYSIGLGLAMASGFITMRMLSIAFGLGILYLVYSLIVSESFWKTYGDISMAIAKDAVKEVVTTVGPIKKCPDRCVVKQTSYVDPTASFDTNVTDKYSPICSKKADEDGAAAPYDYEYSHSNVDSRDFRDCEIGKYGKCKDNRQTSFVCKWETGLRPDNEPEYLNSSVPCHYYNNRVNVKNENI